MAVLYRFLIYIDINIKKYIIEKNILIKNAFNLIQFDLLWKKEVYKVYRYE